MNNNIAENTIKTIREILDEWREDQEQKVNGPEYYLAMIEGLVEDLDEQTKG